ncbi:MAG: MarR family transcriptional regulator [Oceanospirillaceae bacterium]|nr:MarR family transcriptional regulator [Oceanospirillaceae bacterium]
MRDQVDKNIARQKLRVWLRILKITRSIEAELRDKLRIEYGSTLPRFDVLAALYRVPNGLRMSELSSVLKVSNGNITGIITRHVKDNLVERVPVGNDKRAMVVKLTGEGATHFLEMAQSHSQWLDELLNDIDAEDAALLIELLSKVDVKKGELD